MTVQQHRHRDIIHRWQENPVITMRDLPFRCTDICNAGAVKIDGEYILLVTIQSLEGYYWIHLARSKDGYHFDLDGEPFLARSNEGPLKQHESRGVLDPRISRLQDEYYVSYDALGDHGYRVGLACTEDFSTVERLGLISEPDTKGGVLFPEKLKGKYARLERPWESNSIWVTFSDDLKYWGYSEMVMGPRGGFWDCDRIGVATPPLAIEPGWLIIYYGIKGTSAGPLFRLGAAILDAEDPTQVLGRTNVPVLSPRETYERIGDLPNLVFSCGAIIEPDGQVKLYYGGSDSCICVGITTVAAIVQACHESAREF